MTATQDRVKKLLNEDYADRLKTSVHVSYNDVSSSLEEKNFKETYESRKRLINKYFISISKAKTGLENSRDTYADKNTKNAFNLSVQKAEDILNSLQTFERNS